MCASFTDDDVGKPVERTDGKVIGTVAALEEEGAYIEPAPDVIDQLKARFDWGELGSPFLLDESDVREISKTRVHLEAEFSRTPAEGRAGPSAAGTGEAGAGSEQAVSPGNSTADASGVGRLETRFQIGAAVVAGISALLALVFGWFGYQGADLLGFGPELNIVSGMAGLMFLAFAAVVAAVAALYMEPGFDH
ncbi:hypothetical protein GS429_06160 [Natronorubrum sp. JWXQ-INN-674]|uniref:Uncharacterized protein n=1 Tax=Natronorubrum halalkaliphilum TaxID=2691917 RepID=A0A6B0VKD7_9EURY|nr:hypothetical protein [Natronorubrum halalkaliphilum]MXV61653.1 hypothetical protein [Natronorubrum halalkaliphilum]